MLPGCNCKTKRVGGAGSQPKYTLDDAVVLPGWRHRAGMTCRPRLSRVDDGCAEEWSVWSSVGQCGPVWSSVGANNVFASRACSKKDTNSNSVHFGGCAMCSCHPSVVTIVSVWFTEMTTLLATRKKNHGDAGEALCVLSGIYQTPHHSVDQSTNHSWSKHTKI